MPSANLNAIQDEINNIAGAHIESYSAVGIPAIAGAWLHESFGGGSIQDGMVVAALSDLVVPIVAREGARLDQVEIKVEDTGGGGAWAFDLLEVETNWDASGTAPAAALQLAAEDPIVLGAGWTSQLINPGYSLASGPASGSFSVLLDFAGLITQNASVDFFGWSGAVLSGGPSFSFRVNWVGGTFSGLGSTSFPNGIGYDRSVPEPTTLALLGLGLVGIGAATRRKRQV